MQKGCLLSCSGHRKLDAGVDSAADSAIGLRKKGFQPIWDTCTCLVLPRVRKNRVLQAQPHAGCTVVRTPIELPVFSYNLFIGCSPGSAFIGQHTLVPDRPCSGLNKRFRQRQEGHVVTEATVFLQDLRSKKANMFMRSPLGESFGEAPSTIPHRGTLRSRNPAQVRMLPQTHI